MRARAILGIPVLASVYSPSRQGGVVVAVASGSGSLSFPIEKPGERAEAILVAVKRATDDGATPEDEILVELTGGVELRMAPEAARLFAFELLSWAMGNSGEVLT